jgi:hypothetical protein
VTTTNGGATWVDHTIPKGFYGVSCSNSVDCIAVGGGSISATTDGGTTWTNQTAPIGPVLYGISCASPEFCVAVGFVSNKDRPAIVATSDGGATWSNEVIPIPKGSSGRGVLYSVSCPSTTACSAVGGNQVYATSNSGTSWIRGTLPGVSSVSCADSTDCVAVGSNISTTSDGGTTWTSSPLPNGVSDVAGVSCVSTSQCVGVGENSQTGGIVVGYNDPTIALTPTTTTASVAPSKTGPGAPVVFSASVAAQEGSGTPSGSVTFTTGTAWLCTATLMGGSGSCSDGTAPPGPDTVTAVYSGDAAFASSSATTALFVDSGVVCRELSGTSSATVRLAECSTPDGVRLGVASAPAGALTAGGTVTWTKTNQTTIVSLTSSSVGQGACSPGGTEFDIAGTVTGGTSVSTLIGDQVALSVCESASGSLTLVPGTTATL